ncbi:GLPGLI family protein [Flavobacterium sp.]|uniref:GLPGLI family protein n=1 Tax=Flavobacterium sp. TaxID=239 RepID=UPI002489A6E6|nr:GLPGLI family protein [Flavobacterium sp.]MDI1318152.1 GLPGLI family protein [Flavobacterium sp.]
MIKTTFSIALLILGLTTSAQEFQGKAEYFSKYIFKKDKTIEDKVDDDLELSALIKEALNKSSQKSFLLTFSKIDAVYEENEVLEQPNAATGGMSISIKMSGAGKKYINTKEKILLAEDEIFGKEFLIEEPLTQPSWNLKEESKKIGDYTCFKAELIIPVTQKQKDDYQEYLKKEEKKPALFKQEEPKDNVVTAWYTPEIPVSFGPNNYWGLPGLILEINEENQIILCSKVTLNSKAKSEIKRPKNGEKVSQNKFDEIQKKKSDSMKNEDGVIIFSREE